MDDTKAPIDPLSLAFDSPDGTVVISAPMAFWLRQPDVRMMLRSFSLHPAHPPVSDREWMLTVMSWLDLREEAA